MALQRFPISLNNIMDSAAWTAAVLKPLDQAIKFILSLSPSIQPSIKQVKKLCGTPSMSSVKLPLQSTAPATATNSGHKISPPDSEMLQFLVTIDGSKNIYTQIVDR